MKASPSVKSSGSQTYGVAAGTILEDLVPEPIGKFAPRAELDHRVPEHDDGVDLGVQLLGQVVGRGVHHARALRVAHEREGLVGAGRALGLQALYDVSLALDCAGDDLGAGGVLFGVLSGQGQSSGW